MYIKLSCLSFTFLAFHSPPPLPSVILFFIFFSFLFALCEKRGGGCHERPLPPPPAVLRLCKRRLAWFKRMSCFTVFYYVGHSTMHFFTTSLWNLRKGWRPKKNFFGGAGGTYLLRKCNFIGLDKINNVWKVLKCRNMQRNLHTFLKGYMLKLFLENPLFNIRFRLFKILLYPCEWFQVSCYFCFSLSLHVNALSVQTKTICFFYNGGSLIHTSLCQETPDCVPLSSTLLSNKNKFQCQEGWDKTRTIIVHRSEDFILRV